MNRIILSVLLAMLVESQAQFCDIRLHPETLIGLTGYTSTFICQGWRQGDELNWYINDTFYSNGSIQGVQIHEDQLNEYSILKIPESLPVFNNTNFYCSVNNNGYTCNSRRVSLYLQGGDLSEVTGLDVQLVNFDCFVNGSVMVTWMSPFTLDISDNDIDIIYRVELLYYSSMRIIREGITDTQFSAVLPDGFPENASCDTFELIITPYNAAGNGSSAEIINSPFDRENLVITMLNGKYLENHTIVYTLQIEPAICDIDTTMLVDIFFNETYLLDEENIQVSSSCNNFSNIYMKLMIAPNFNLKSDRHYNATFDLHSNVNNITINTTISTFDVQYFSFSNDGSNIDVSFLENSSAMGAMLLFFTTNSSPKFFTLSIKNSQQYKIPSAMSGRKLVLFDIEDNGYLPQGKNFAATSAQIVPTMVSSYERKDVSFIDRCLLMRTSENMVISVLCECDQELNYQVILFNDYDPSHQIYTSIAPCSTSVNLNIDCCGLYHATAFTGEVTTGIVGSGMYYIDNITVGFVTTENMPMSSPSDTVIYITIGSILPPIILIFVVCLSGSIYYYCRKRKSVTVSDSKLSAKELLSSEQDDLEMSHESTTSYKEY